MKSERFVVLTLQEARKFDHTGEWTEGFEDWEYVGFLVDTKTNRIVFSDSMEHKDANFRRAFRPLVELLNEIDLENQNA